MDAPSTSSRLPDTTTVPLNGPDSTRQTRHPETVHFAGKRGMSGGAPRFRECRRLTRKLAHPPRGMPGRQAATSGWSASTTAIGLLDPDLVVEGATQLLLAPEVTLCGLDRDMAEQKLDLVPFARRDGRASHRCGGGREERASRSLPLKRLPALSTTPPSMSSLSLTPSQHRSGRIG